LASFRVFIISNPEFDSLRNRIQRTSPRRPDGIGSIDAAQAKRAEPFNQQTARFYELATHFEWSALSTRLTEASLTLFFISFFLFIFYQPKILYRCPESNVEIPRKKILTN